MADAACTLRIPLVYGAVKGFIGQVAVFAPHQGTACYRCLFPADTPMQEKTPPPPQAFWVRMRASSVASRPWKP